MTSKRYLSDKKSKISQTTISTSPALKDWISRFVNVQKKKLPDDERFKSVSAFYNFVMESVLTILEKGKTLDDFKRLVDTDVMNFYDNITFKAILPFYESSIEFNKYIDDDLDLIFKLALRYRSFVIEKNDFENDKNIISILNRFKNFLLSNKITKLFNFEFIDNKFIIEYSAHYPNIHFNYAKLLMALASAMGLIVRNIFYDKHDNYIKIDTEKTDLFFDKKLRIKERKVLLKQNVAFIINDLYILTDKPQHLWIKLSENIDTLISFRNIKTGIETICNMIKNLQKHLNRKELHKLILKIFKTFHWITIIDENTLSFQILLNVENSKEREIMKKVIDNYSNMKELDGILYLE